MSSSHHVRCTDCGAQIPGAQVASDFRCRICNGLFEVFYPWSPANNDLADREPHSPATPNTGGPVNPAARLPNPSALRYLWEERRSSTMPVDQSGVWRFRDLLPILDDVNAAVTLREGNTPLYDLPRNARALGLDFLLAKHQGMNPTGSFKDCGMTTALSVARERGFEWVACASTGNTSAAMAAYAARAGLRSIVFIPEGKIAWGKLSQSMDYGALTIQLRTDFDGCVRILADLVRRFPIYLLNSVNPYRLEGQKTPAFEIAEQLDWQVPDHIVVPGGNLANSAALGKGFAEMHHLGLIHRIPTISVVQAEGANPLYRTMRENGGRELVPVVAETRASAIRIGRPASWRKSIRILQSTGGWVEQVSEAEIALAKAQIGAEGIGCEPASAVTLAGLKKLVGAGRIQPDQRVVLLLTGHTLKDSDYTIHYHRGELLNAEEDAAILGQERSEHLALQKPPVVLDADPDTVLRALEAHMALEPV